MTATRVTIHGRGSTIVLPCGLVVEGRPHDTPEYAATARDLGYGADVLAMSQHHDALHALLCRWLGLPESYSLRQAAGMPVDGNLAAQEEAAVMAVQRFAKHAGVDVRRLVEGVE